MVNFTMSKDGNIDLSKHTITGVGVKNISEVNQHLIEVVDGRVNHKISFNNGGHLHTSWDADGSNFTMQTKKISFTINDDSASVPNGVSVMAYEAPEQAKPSTLQ